MIVQFLVPTKTDKDLNQRYRPISRIMASPPHIGETVSIPSTSQAIVFYTITEVEYLIQSENKPFDILTAQLEVVHCTLEFNKIRYPKLPPVKAGHKKS